MQSCSFCHTMTDQRTCPNCGHRADVARVQCDCPQCYGGMGHSPGDADLDLLAGTLAVNRIVRKH